MGFKNSNNITDAFTLVELLVVIAIISVLAGMLMPVLENTIESAKSISCTSNEKQIYSSCMFYVNDYNDWLINSYAKTHEQYWHNALRYLEYIEDSAISNSIPSGIFRCPSTDISLHSKGTQYAMNLAITYENNSIYHWRQLSYFKKPSQVFYFMDGGRWAIGAANVEPIGIYIPHNDGANFCYIDGHSEWLEDWPGFGTYTEPEWAGP